MADNNTRKSGMAVDSALVRELAELLGETGLTEIEVEDGDRRIRVARNIMAAAPQMMQAAAPAAAAPVAAAIAAPVSPPAEPTGTPVKSPMVGTAFLSSEPGSAPFVSVGDSVKAGETLLIVEAMKVMNPIIAPAAGTIQAILVGNGDPVEYDQPLVIFA